MGKDETKAGTLETTRRLISDCFPSGEVVAFRIEYQPRYSQLHFGSKSYNHNIGNEVVICFTRRISEKRLIAASSLGVSITTQLPKTIVKHLSNYTTYNDPRSAGLTVEYKLIVNDVFYFNEKIRNETWTNFCEVFDKEVWSVLGDDRE